MRQKKTNWIARKILFGRRLVNSILSGDTADPPVVVPRSEDVEPYPLRDETDPDEHLCGDDQVGSDA
jgi:hypothetical protein